MPKIEPEVQEFVDSVGARFPIPSDREHTLFDVVTKRGNYFVHPDGFLIVKLSRSLKPFWGLGKKHIDFLDSLLENYFLVLLESSNSGYLFDKSQIQFHIKRGAWGLTGTEYKINVGSLPRPNVFHNTEQLLMRIRSLKK